MNLNFWHINADAVHQFINPIRETSSFTIPSNLHNVNVSAPLHHHGVAGTISESQLFLRLFHTCPTIKQKLTPSCPDTCTYGCVLLSSYFTFSSQRQRLFQCHTNQ